MLERPSRALFQLVIRLGEVGGFPAHVRALAHCRRAAKSRAGERHGRVGLIAPRVHAKLRPGRR